MAETGVPLDLLAVICSGLAEQLPLLTTPDLTLAGLRSDSAVSRSPLALAALCERDHSVLAHLLRLLDLSPHWRGELLSDPEAFDALRQSDGQPVTREELSAAAVLAEASGLADEPASLTPCGAFQ